MSEARARKLVYGRSEGRCEACGVASALEWHHRKNRSQRGLWTASNGLHLCPRCHRKVTDTHGKRKQYESWGWVVPSWLAPELVPALIARPRQGRVWNVLHDDGSVTVMEATRAAALMRDLLGAEQADFGERE